MFFHLVLMYMDLHHLQLEFRCKLFKLLLATATSICAVCTAARFNISKPGL